MKKILLCMVFITISFVLTTYTIAEERQLSPELQKKLETLKAQTIKEMKSRLKSQKDFKTKSGKGVDDLEPVPIDKKGWCKYMCDEVGLEQCVGWQGDPDYAHEDCIDPMRDFCYNWCIGPK